MNKKLFEFALNHWVCKLCGNVNPMHKLHRKRKEIQKRCVKCKKGKIYPRAF